MAATILSLLPVIANNLKSESKKHKKYLQDPCMILSSTFLTELLCNQLKLSSCPSHSDLLLPCLLLQKETFTTHLQQDCPALIPNDDMDLLIPVLKTPLMNPFHQGSTNSYITLHCNL